MGWLYSSSWSSPASVRDHLKDQIAKSGSTIKADALVAYGRRYYAAITGKDGRTFIGVFLINGSRHSGFGYKDIDEFMGPNEVDCPLSVLDAADPIEAFAGDYNADGGLKWATDWRANVRAHHATRAASRTVAKTVKAGDNIWIKHRTEPFKVTRIDGRRLYASQGFTNYRIPKTWIVRHEPKAPAGVN